MEIRQSRGGPLSSTINVLTLAVMLAVVFGFGPLVEGLFEDRRWREIDTPPVLPEFSAISKLPPPLSINYPGAAKVWAYEAEESESIFLVVAFYQQEDQGQELVSSDNRFLNHEHWRRDFTVPVSVEELSGGNEYRQMAYRAEGRQAISVWSQYRFTGLTTSIRPLTAKLLGLRDALRNANSSAELSIIFRGKSMPAGMKKGLAKNLNQVLLPAIDEQIRAQERSI